jgi:hypothetical protein
MVAMVYAESGMDTRADPSLNLYHAWVESRASNGDKWVIDFTPKYWRAAVMMPGDPWRPIDWVVSPPDEFIGPMSKVSYKLKGREFTPPLGKLTLIKCPRTTAWVRKALETLPRSVCLIERVA